MNKNLQAEMARAGFTNKALAEKVDVGEVAFGNKIKGKSEWVLREMLAIQKIINTELNTTYSLDYLFQKF